MDLTRWNWPKLFSYGEVMCFVTAWAVSLAIAMHEQRPASNSVAAGTIAASSTWPGIQANLHR
jgi:hypothetical protein